MRRYAPTALTVAFVAALSAAAFAGAAPPTAVEDGVLFSHEAPAAATVHLAGEFNGWDPAALPMGDEDGDGVWEVVIKLQEARTYQYKFVIDGGAVWEPDPSNPETVDDNYGGRNSVMSVTEDGEIVLGALAGPASSVYEPVVDDLESLGRPISVAVVWHQHQPKYLKDLETGEYMEPWVRMHCIKDYYDMVAILEEFPRIHLTVNLTPILLTQIDDVIEGYRNGGGTDAYLRMTLKDAAELTEADRLYLITHFFNAHWDNMIHVWPRYKELKAKKGGDTHEELLASARTFSEQDWRDLQAWFNLAWFDPDFQERGVTLPDGNVVTVRHLIEKGRGYTEADKREIIETQIAIMENVVAVHRELQETGQLEVITTPFYHPILPLIYDTDLAKVATPGSPLPVGGFRRPDDARRHVEMAADYYEELFGRPPVGMWPAEGAVAQEIVGIVADAGFKWVASDDQVLSRSRATGSLSEVERYRLYQVGDGGSELAMIFRDHRLSDDIGFNFGKMDGVQAANSMMRSLYGIHKRFAADESGHVVPIILDGENAWEWYRHDGKEFFRSWYDQMSRAEWVETVTVAEYLEEHPPIERIERLWAGSWISHDFSTWIGEPEENRAWECLAQVRTDLAEAEAAGTLDSAVLEAAYDEMLAAEGSDWFWWYGSDQTSSLEDAFDAIFRGMLANVYEIIGSDELPECLGAPIRDAEAPQSGGGVMARAYDAGDADLLAGPIALDGGYLFSTEQSAAASVHLAGGFNDWSTDATPLSDEDGDGIWTVVVELRPGTYEYKFVVDGGAVWVEDVGNPSSVPDPYGGVNSVVVVE